MRRRRPEAFWTDADPFARLVRGVLAPASAVYAGVTGARNALYDARLLPVVQPAVPALSLGNLSVGGTGKTPMAAWAALQLRDRGGRPAIVLRGYGDDEPLVHARLAPEVPVIIAPDRVRGAEDAARQGADCVVLDDAFQHRRIARVADWVLVAAEQWRDDAWRLPAGPLREPARALRRASLVVVTRKVASLAQAESLAARLATLVPGAASAVVHLAPAALRSLAGAVRPLSDLAGRRFLAVAAIGAPAPFFAQLRALGADLDELPLADHHAFTDDDLRRIAARAVGTDGVVCTLKDAVKLAPRGRGAMPPLWYVSQAVAVERGGDRLDASLGAVLAARVLPL